MTSVPDERYCTTVTENFQLMNVVMAVPESIAHPFGDERSVKQAFPQSVPAEVADPFLMCDFFGMEEKKSPSSDPDYFPVDWHPHRGIDLLSYIKTGVGRHGDSMGNRETFATPGMQWISSGSGIEHAEGGGNEKGVLMKGFQIWVNEPAARKMDDPSYGTNPPESIPLIPLAKGATVRVLAGSVGAQEGPIKFAVKDLQILDFELEAGSEVQHEIPENLDCAILYVYEGSGSTNGKSAGERDKVFVLDAKSGNNIRGLSLKAAANGLSAMLFSGKKLNEPIAWHGPIVMNTQDQLRQTFHELQQGTFPPVRAAWDYKRLSTFPKDHPARQQK
jgi:redox-sensitive bicupin YhaK (pirin superfamily)